MASQVESLRIEDEKTTVPERGEALSTYVCVIDLASFTDGTRGLEMLQKWYLVLYCFLHFIGEENWAKEEN